MASASRSETAVLEQYCRLVAREGVANSRPTRGDRRRLNGTPDPITPRGHTDPGNSRPGADHPPASAHRPRRSSPGARRAAGDNEAVEANARLTGTAAALLLALLVAEGLTILPRPRVTHTARRDRHGPRARGTPEDRQHHLALCRVITSVTPSTAGRVPQRSCSACSAHSSSC